MVDAERTVPVLQDQEGTLTWELELEPGQSKEIRLRYRVSLPSAEAVFGLE